MCECLEGLNTDICIMPLCKSYPAECYSHTFNSKFNVRFISEIICIIRGNRGGSKCTGEAKSGSEVSRGAKAGDRAQGTAVHGPGSPSAIPSVPNFRTQTGQKIVHTDSKMPVKPWRAPQFSGANCKQYYQKPAKETELETHNVWEKTIPMAVFYWGFMSACKQQIAGFFVQKITLFAWIT